MQWALVLSWGGFSMLCYDLKIGLDSFFWISLVFYIFIGGYLLRCYISLLAKDQLDAEWSIFMSDFEAVPINPDNFPDLDHVFYDSSTRILEENGFDKLNDYDLTHMSRAFPIIRTFDRVLISRKHDIWAVVTQKKASKVIVPLFLTFRVDHRLISFGTEFTDGTFLETNNARGINDVAFEGVMLDSHPPNTPIEQLLAYHRESVARIYEEQGVETRLCFTEADVFAAAARQHLLIRQDRLKKGGGTIEMSLREIAKPTTPNSEEYYKAYLKQALQRAEQERRRQSGEEF